MTDKQSDNDKDEKGTGEEAPKRRAPRAGAPAAKEAVSAVKKPAGPVIVKATKARKLVAAGTAEDVEIQAELENATPEEKDETAE